MMCVVCVAGWVVTSLVLFDRTGYLLLALAQCYLEPARHQVLEPHLVRYDLQHPINTRHTRALIAQDTHSTGHS